jgi:catechol 2,3-dioxygenase-like lactoylglutathione lyase family enzyme
MRQQLSLVTLVVDDYNRAIDYFTRILRFALVQDTWLTDDKRWVVVAPQGSTGTGLLLAEAADEPQKQAVGRQAGGRVFLFLQTDDFQRYYTAYCERGVTFIEEPRHELYGTVAVFADIYGNRWDLVEPKASLDGDRPV